MRRGERGSSELRQDPLDRQVGRTTRIARVRGPARRMARSTSIAAVGPPACLSATSSG